jgi:hypothetical protein
MSTKITTLTTDNVRALTGLQTELQVTELGKTFAVFNSTPQRAMVRLRRVMDEIAAKSAKGSRDTSYRSLHAVMRKLEKSAEQTSSVPSAAQRKAVIAKETAKATAKKATSKKAAAKLNTEQDTIPTDPAQLKQLIKITRDRRWRAGRRNDVELVKAMDKKLAALTGQAPAKKAAAKKATPAKKATSKRGTAKRATGATGTQLIAATVTKALAKGAAKRPTKR